MYVKPPHLRGTRRCWRAKSAIYGTLSAAGDFQDELRDGMKVAVGMASGKAYPTVFYHGESDARGRRDTGTT